MEVRILDLDGSVTAQEGLQPHLAAIQSGMDWAPHIRLACSHGRFRRFERALAERFGAAVDETPWLTLYGSGDFHHVSLALLRRLEGPCNLLVLDNHPDWMTGVPFLHCGTWLYHAAKLPQVRRIFHVGGDVDFDNAYRPLAPWPLLRSGKITVFPAVRRFTGGGWNRVEHQSLRSDQDTRLTAEHLAELLRPHREDLAGLPLYISLDKDVMRADDAVVNWDSGWLELAEVCTVLEGFAQGCGGHFAGMDIVGDWSPVSLRGVFRRLFHWTMHPGLAVTPDAARRRNEEVNRTLLATMRAARTVARPTVLPVTGH